MSKQTETVKLDRDRLKELEAVVLAPGTGKSLENACIMQAVDYVTSGGLSDYPECACPALTSYAIRINDSILSWTTGAERKGYSDRLKALIPKLVGTRDDRAMVMERAHFFVHHSITIVLPILTDAVKLPEDSKRLRAFKIGEWREMREFCNDLRSRLRKAMGQGLAESAAASAAIYAANAAYAAATAATAAAAANAAAITPPQLRLHRRLGRKRPLARCEG
jgi:hypothetical protein